MYITSIIGLSIYFMVSALIECLTKEENERGGF